MILPEELKAVLKPNFKTETLYKTKPSESDSKMEQLLNLCLEAKSILETHAKGQAETEALRIVKRFIKEQANYDENTKRLKVKSNKVSHFPLETCKNCALAEQCPAKEQKKDFVVRIDKKAIEAAKQRLKIESERWQNTSDRAAIEGTNSALKRAHGLGKLRVRGQAKCTVVVGYKVIAHNFKMFARYMIEQLKNPLTPIQGGLCPKYVG